MVVVDRYRTVHGLSEVLLVKIQNGSSLFFFSPNHFNVVLSTVGKIWPLSERASFRPTATKMV
jgi:hypothetical protein